ncbi:hypothetical protein AcW1_000191 [Taiwanofungus camphoratus]|nr:hypothetical protein AcW1_000191 [Antrodia cinnamomea]
MAMYFYRLETTQCLHRLGLLLLCNEIPSLSVKSTRFHTQCSEFQISIHKASDSKSTSDVHSKSSLIWSYAGWVTSERSQ